MDAKRFVKEEIKRRNLEKVLLVMENDGKKSTLPVQILANFCDMKQSIAEHVAEELKDESLSEEELLKKFAEDLNAIIELNY
ncbi:MAG: hypothetical protein ACTJGH_00500 [Peptoniphilaceae bacterium]